MPKPFKPTRPCPLPADADLVAVNGKPHVRFKERGKPVLYPLTRDGAKYLRPARCWYFDLRDANGIVRRVKGFTDLRATEQRAAEMERKASRVRSGFIDPAEEHARRPLADHLKDYAAALEAKGCTVDHVRLVTGRVAAMVAGCGFVFPLDADAGKASEWLNGLRRDAAPMHLPDRDSFTPAEAAKLLGISGSSVRAAVTRLNLPATGNGKARALPRATVEAIARQRAKGVGPETINHYIRAVRGFFRWLVKAKRLGSNPLESLSLVNSALDVRRARRELTADELRRLFQAARESRRTFRGLTGVDRYFLYLTAAGTGFRASALANLTPDDFDLSSPSPVVTLAARFNKSRRLKVQPIPADVAEALAAYLDGKPSNAPVWGGTWAKDHKGAVMLRVDLGAAEIAYAVEGPDGPEYADFHSLRHSYLTLGGRSGIDLRTLQELAGHSRPELTARYSHRRLYDLGAAVSKLPNLVPTAEPDADASAAATPLRLTGTDPTPALTRADTLAAKSAVPDAVTGRAGLHSASPMYTSAVSGHASDGTPQPLGSTGLGASSRPFALISISEDDGARTRNLRRDRPDTSRSKSNRGNAVTATQAAARSAGCSGRQGEGGRPDADLAALTAAWPNLPEPIKAAIRAMVATVADHS